MYIFDVEPMGAVRMTQSDRWKRGDDQRDAVARYFAYKEELQLKANLMKYRLGNQITIEFYIPMPKSWSKEQKAKMRNKPCKSKPDTDNLLKGFTDALTTDDARIWHMVGRKYWWDTGEIRVITNLFDDDEDPEAVKVTIYDVRSKTKNERKNVKINSEAFATRGISIQRREARVYTGRK